MKESKWEPPGPALSPQQEKREASQNGSMEGRAGRRAAVGQATEAFGYLSVLRQQRIQ